MKSILVIVVFLYPLIHSTVPPESYELQPEVKGREAKDVTLENWLSEFKLSKNVFEYDAKSFAKSIQKFDKVTQSYLNLRYANLNSLPKPQLFKKTLNDAFSESEPLQSHPLKPYIYEELLENDALKEKMREPLLQKLVEQGSNSCPHKQILLKEIEDEDFKSKSQSKLRGFVKKIATFRSKSFKKQAVEEIVEILGEEGVEPLIEDLTPIVKSIPSPDIPEDLLEKFEIESEYANASLSTEAQSLLTYLRQKTKKRKCYQAKSKLTASIGKLKSLKTLEQAETFVAKVESCYRRKGNKSRLSFWKAISPTLEKAYGFDGKLLALKKQGAVHWLIDEFKAAKKIFLDIRKMAQERKDKKLEAYALHTLGRVAENEGVGDQAIKYYKSYAELFPEGEKVDEVYMSLVLLFFDQRDFSQSFRFAEEIMDHQLSQSEKDRNGSALSFAYFWAGRSALHQNKRKTAMIMWKRAASEYYSTFYGAMGHYLYEQVNGKQYYLEPSRSTTFRPAHFLARFDQDDRKILARAMLLLQAGLKQDANCEVMELLTTDDKDNDRVLMKSLLLFASGDWLESIKSYASLPRSYRGALPSGFERLLFPQAFTEDIERHSQKLNVESAIIYAIIRQESVFNPRARSPAGARGLMQLMPATARYESSRLSRSYLPNKQRLALQRSARNRSNLYKPGDNIALGVHHVYRLLKKYKNPVFVLTAYNASPRATARWQKSMPTEDLLSFIEKIPYQETRLYVKLVMRNYFFYKKWYEKPDLKYPYLYNIVSKDLALLAPPKKKG